MKTLTISVSVSVRKVTFDCGYKHLLNKLNCLTMYSKIILIILSMYYYSTTADTMTDLIPTHYQSGEYIGYTAVAIRSIQVDISVGNTAPEIAIYDGLKTQLDISYDGRTFTSAQTKLIGKLYTKKIKDLLNEVIKLIRKIKEAIETVTPLISSNRIEVTNNVNKLSYKLDHDKFDFTQLLLAEIVPQIVSGITLHAKAANFVQTAEYSYVDSLSNLAITNLEELKADLNFRLTLIQDLAKTDITDSIKTFVRQELNLDYTHNLGLEVQSRLSGGTTSFTTILSMELSSEPIKIYRYAPIPFDECYIDSIYYLDKTKRVYRQSYYNAYLPVEADQCLKGLLSVNETLITKHCPLAKQTYPYAHVQDGIVFTSLSENTNRSLENASITITSTPFIITGGSYNLTLGDTITQFALGYDRQTTARTLPFASEALCPPKPKEPLTIRTIFAHIEEIAIYVSITIIMVIILDRITTFLVRLLKRILRVFQRSLRIRGRTLIPQRPDAHHHNLTVIYGRRGHPAAHTASYRPRNSNRIVR